MDIIHTSTAVWKEKCYTHFGIHPMIASLYGDDPKDIINVKIEISKDQKKPNPEGPYVGADYWGWYDFEKKKFTMIYAQYFLLNMCFPYGLKTEEERNIGKAYRLLVTALS